jgi:hypothetical protein
MCDIIFVFTGLAALDHMKANTDLSPDAMTYTSLISSVARRATMSSGKSDPDLAFSLLDEMVNVLKIRPNGMTYCALIDVCSRCRRSDLALKGKLEDQFILEPYFSWKLDKLSQHNALHALLS